MPPPSILERLTRSLRNVFDNDSLVATRELTAQDVDGWDSINNVRLFIEIERDFSIRFSAAEITSLENVGQLADLIEIKLHDSQMTP